MATETSGFLLDTTVLLDWAHGLPSAIETVEFLFSQPGQLYTCDVVTCEALSGGDLDERTWIASMLDVLEYVAVDPEAARWAAANRREGRARGPKRSTGDALIAAAAWRLGATLVTRNPRDFERQGVRVLRYG